MTQWFKHEVRRVYALLCETDEERDERRLVEWIDRKGGAVTARDVQMGCRWLREAGLAEAALNALVQSGQGIVGTIAARSPWPTDAPIPTDNSVNRQR